MIVKLVLLLICALLIGILGSLYKRYRRELSAKEQDLTTPFQHETAADEMVENDEGISHHVENDSNTHQTISALNDKALNPLATHEHNSDIAQSNFNEIKILHPVTAPPSIVSKGDILVIYVLAANNQLFSGHELLETLINQNLHFGDMNIFHHHEHAKGVGRKIFSVAQAVEPGYFDLSDVSVLQCPGLSLFMDLSKTNDAFNDFKLMLNVARTLEELLDGVLKDEHYHLLDTDKLKYYYQHLDQYQAQQLDETVTTS